jgi:predicted nucleic acid-binding protein
MEHPDSLLIMDEKKGRRIALNLGLKLTGLLGIIIRAKEKGIIKEAKVLLDALESKGFHLSPALRKMVLEKSGENK